MKRFSRLKQTGKAQGRMKNLYDRRVKVHTFSPGDMVLANLLVAGSPFQARFSGPYSVKRRASDVNYLISTPDRRESTLVCQFTKILLFSSSKW